MVLNSSRKFAVSSVIVPKSTKGWTKDKKKQIFIYVVYFVFQKYTILKSHKKQVSQTFCRYIDYLDKKRRALLYNNLLKPPAKDRQPQRALKKRNTASKPVAPLNLFTPVG